MRSSPRLTVLMPVFNAERYVASAMESILHQTFDDFEFLIISDGSTDASVEIIKSFPDPRVRLIQRENRGLSATLNEGLVLASCELVARQDADDLSEPTRLESQIEVLSASPGLGLLGTNYQIIDDRGDLIDKTDLFCDSRELKTAIVLSNQFGHGSVMMRRRVAQEAGGYDPAFKVAQDYDLWTRMSHISEIANLKEHLYRWRRTSSGASMTDMGVTLGETFVIRDREFAHLLSHRSEYPIFWRLRPDGPGYLRKRSFAFSNLAYLYRKARRRIIPIPLAVASLLCAPLRKRSYVHLLMLFNRRLFTRWRYYL